MATTFTGLTTQTTQSIAITATKTVDGVAVAGADTESLAQTLQFGAADDQNDVAYVTKAKSIAASGTLTLDLSGALTDLFGDTINFAKVKAIYIENKSTNDATIIEVRRPLTNGVPLLDTANVALQIPKGGALCLTSRLAAGLFAVTAGTADLLDVINLDATNAATVNIVIVGTSV